MKKFVSFMSGVLMGGFIGATVALLLAPYSGENLRGEIQERFGAFQADLNEAVSQRKVELEKKLDDLRQPKAAA